MSDHLQDSAGAGIEELDLTLINTLQLDPRAPWSRVGKALDLDPVTVARRWARLRDTGTAWVTPQLGPPHSAQVFTALVEVDCEAGRAPEVAGTLATLPHVVTVEHTSGGRDLMLTVAVPSLSTLSRYLMEVLEALPGVRTTRTQLVTRIYAQGGDWRLRALDARQRARLATAGNGHAAPASRLLTEHDRRLMTRLCVDGRTSLADLASDTGVSVSTARRRLHALLTSGDLVLRCEVAQPLSGWPVCAGVMAHVPGDARDIIAQQLSALPETRLCVAVTGGKANLYYGAWLRSLEDVQQLEYKLAEQVPRLTILDRVVVLRFVKRMGRILDADGRSTEVVPMDIWSDPFGPANPE